ncbi:MAG TPA: hypothetical protein V6D22_22480 [Candidatus Obscuribacterales bacterium]
MERHDCDACAVTEEVPFAGVTREVLRLHTLDVLTAHDFSSAGAQT